MAISSSSSRIANPGTLTTAPELSDFSTTGSTSTGGSTTTSGPPKLVEHPRKWQSDFFAQEWGADMNQWGTDYSNYLLNLGNYNYDQAMPLANHLSGVLEGNTNTLTGYGNSMFSGNNPISQTAGGLIGVGDKAMGAGQSAYNGAVGAGQGVYNDAMGLGSSIFDTLTGRADAFAGEAMGVGQGAYNQALGVGQGMYGDALSLGAGAMNAAQSFMQTALNAPNNLRLGTTNAGAQGDAYFDEYQTVYRPAAEKLIQDAQRFNTEAYREDLAQQAMGDVSRQSAVAQDAAARNMAAMGVDPNSGRALAMQRAVQMQDALARSNAANMTRIAAEQAGFDRLNTALANKAGSHLIQGANDAASVAASVENANTGALASVTNAGLGAAANALGSGLSAQANLFGSGVSGLSNALHSGTSALNNALNTSGSVLSSMYGNAANAQANLFNTGADALMMGHNIGADALMKGYDIGANAYNNAGGLYADAGRLGIDALAGANNSAITSLGLKMAPGQQLVSDAVQAMYPKMWGWESLMNGYMNHKNMSMADDGRHSALVGSILGAVGDIAGGFAGGLK